ncbi:MAG: TetR/AcrR family transcriptional regulator [Thermoleophilaceae bacterium]|nr:TetR/AcrR family transcriptional regulator [Thermoleophilaceae bacterium]
MAQPLPPTSKGVRQSQEILDAALRCLGRDGYASTSLARVAEEAGVSKRMVLYYFDSRETLFVQLTKSIGDKLLAQLEQAVAGIQDPGQVTQAGFEQMWSAITADRALLIALFGVTIESVTDERLAEAVGDFKEGIRELLRKQLVDARAHGRRIVVDDETAVTATMTGFFGLAFEWLETGDTPELQQTIAGYQQMVAAMAPPAK